jgi:hypothetical protein
LNDSKDTIFGAEAVMNAPLLPGQSLMPDTSSISLEDKFTLEHGRAFLTGTQALIRLPMLQRERDVRAGLNTRKSIWKRITSNFIPA